MSVPVAFLTVIVIWSTTPLAIKWSSEGSGFLFGVLGRMALGAIVCLMLVKLMRVELPWHRQARYSYAAAAIGVYGAMLTVYWGAQFIPSGLISVIFGLSPLITAVMAAFWLGERSLTPAKVIGMSAGLSGLLVIFGFGYESGITTLYGIGAVFLSVVLHSGSAILIKRIGYSMHALALTCGALLFAVPMYLVTWWVFDGVLPQHLPERTVMSIIYLGIIGSALGFILYYYVLNHVDASKVALLTLVTPVIALLLGEVFNGETIGIDIWLGTAMILLGLLIHQSGVLVERTALLFMPRKADGQE